MSDGVTLDRVVEIEQGRGAPPTPAELEQIETAKAPPGLTRLSADLARQFEESREPLRAMAQLIRRVQRLPAPQRRHFGQVRVRDAERVLRQFERRAPAIVHEPRRREAHIVATPRERRARRSSSTAPRAGPDDEPGPGRAGYHKQLRVIPLSAFRADLERGLGGAA